MSSGKVRWDFCRKVFGLQKILDSRVGSKSWWICISLSCVKWVNIMATWVAGTPSALDSGVGYLLYYSTLRWHCGRFLTSDSLFPHLENEEENFYLAGLQGELLILCLKCLLSGKQTRMTDHSYRCSWEEEVSKDTELKSFSFFPMKNFESSRRER